MRAAASFCLTARSAFLFCLTGRTASLIVLPHGPYREIHDGLKPPYGFHWPSGWARETSREVLTYGSSSTGNSQVATRACFVSRRVPLRG
ncbi:hypothetical protein GCM10011499_31380 [Pelagibacterium lentulum]|uniref:Uncharacterized protein n=1 Tax=Pelagibacterium lentulum TaxID=2029865 RepID=A0A916RJF7_9HYPH|nr:hypothetical protein GCM10011499_31380 [Pelagibacterium lentulum]